MYYWRRGARIAPAHWVSLLLAYFLMLRGREQIEVPEASGALMHYPPKSCPGESPVRRPRQRSDGKLEVEYASSLGCGYGTC